MKSLCALLMLSTAAMADWTDQIADCEGFGKVYELYDEQLKLDMDNYRHVVNEIRDSPNNMLSKAIEADEKAVASLADLISVLEKGQSLGCFGTGDAAKGWWQQLLQLKGKRFGFQNELNTLRFLKQK